MLRLRMCYPMPEEMPAIVQGSLRGVRKHIHDATDNLSELLTGAPRDEWAGRIGFVVRDLAAAQQTAIEAMRYWAEHCCTEAERIADDA